jgi:hypothetical protein
MFHTSAYYSTVANDNALHQITAVADSILRPSGNGLQIPSSIRKLIGVVGIGVTATRFQFQAPSLRDQPYPTIMPANIGTKAESPPRWQSFLSNPFTLDAYEELDAYAANNNGVSGSYAQYAGIWLCDTPPVPATGRVLKVRWTGTTTLTANAWSAVTPTFDQSLQVGQYAIVGGWTQSAGALLFRIVPASGSVYRPGGVAGQTFDDMGLEGQRDGRWGQWMTFDSLTPPNIEILSSSADTAESGVLDLIQL